MISRIALIIIVILTNGASQLNASPVRGIWEERLSSADELMSDALPSSARFGGAIKAFAIDEEDHSRSPVWAIRTATTLSDYDQLHSESERLSTTNTSTTPTGSGNVEETIFPIDVEDDDPQRQYHPGKGDRQQSKYPTDYNNEQMKKQPQEIVFFLFSKLFLPGRILRR